MRSRSRRTRPLPIASIALACSLGILRTASADSPVAPGTRPFWAQFGIGPSIFIATENSDAASTWLHLNQQVGVHFLGDASGPAIALDVHETFGWWNYGVGSSTLFAFRVGPRFQYDIQLVRSLGLYLSPYVGVGWGYWNYSGSFFGFRGTATGNALDLSAGVEVRLVLGNRGVIAIRPLGFDFPIVFWNAPMGTQNSRVFLSYELLFSGGVIF